jgi:hypothetical protein
LVDGQLAEIDSGLRDNLSAILLIYSPEAIGPQLRVVDAQLVPFVEDEVQDPLGLNLTTAVDLPDLDGGLLVPLILHLKFRNNDQFLERIVEVLLVVVERRVLHSFYFLLLFSQKFLSCFFLIFIKLRTKRAMFIFCWTFRSNRALVGKFAKDFFYLKVRPLKNIIKRQSLSFHQYFNLVLIPKGASSKQMVLLIAKWIVF